MNKGRSGRRLRIALVYRRSAMHHGSTQMRVHQLRSTVQPHLEDFCDIALLAMPNKSRPMLQRLWARRARNFDVLVFSKHAVAGLADATVNDLRLRGTRLVFDHVDTDMSHAQLSGAHVHLASSLGQATWLEAQQGSGDKVHLLHHAPDLRLRGPDHFARRDFSVVYCGSSGALYLPPSAEARVTRLMVHSTEDMGRALPDLPRHCMHYAVRNDERRRPAEFRPFTKGFTAAICAANVMAYAATNDAVSLLGADYPYLVQTLEPMEILETLDQAQRDFGTPTWKDAFGRMENLARLVQPEAQATAFRSAIEKAMS